MKHHHHHDCTHCACDNPVLKFLKNETFNDENLSLLTKNAAPSVPQASQNLVVTGGTIRPMIGGSTASVAAIGFAGGKVIATGTLASVEAAMKSGGYTYTVKQLQSGQTLLPGLIEPHVHIVPTALMMGWLDVGAFIEQDLNPDYDMSWVAGILDHYVKTLPSGNWLLARGLDPAFMPFTDNGGLQTITNSLLDTIVSSVPVLIISASMHTMYANTAALTAIYNSSTAVQAQYGTLQQYIAETAGALQEEAGMGPAVAAIPKDQYAKLVLGAFEHITTMFQEANKRGATFLYDAGMTAEFSTLLAAYLKIHAPKVRVGAAKICYTQDDVNALPVYTPVSEYKDMYYGHVKLVSDGSNQGLTGYQSAPYACPPPNNYGIFNFTDPGVQDPTTPPTLYQNLVKTVLVGKSWPLMIHANGDRAVQFAVDVYSTYVPQQKQQSLRHRIEHCSLLTSTQLATMASLGVSPSFLIGHVGYWGYAFNSVIFGSAKSAMLDLCKSALSNGLRITLHSDHSVSPLGPLRMMEQSITRIMEADKDLNVLNGNECLTAEQALVAATTDAAWQCYAENWVGSLAAGHFADFVILAQDPLAVTPVFKNMRNIKVLETWLGGAQVYSGVAAETAAGR